MEGMVLETQFFNPTIAAAGLAVLLAVAIGGLLFSYVADEEAKGRQIDWLEEPLAVPGEYGQAQEIKLKKAA
ncbi:MAG: hypothetical protein HYY12_07250 [Candidatus Methylomirabilis oxyfera]|nr:hypothetical protein [Candidatus Methylomirabilis oxyfera]